MERVVADLRCELGLEQGVEGGHFIGCAHAVLVSF